MIAQNKSLNKISEPFKSNKSVVEMSYNIVKARGKEIKVQTTDREKTTFTIQLSFT